jgi:FKBP-type peptidyl-prolyl cis-trans isomerase
MKKISFIITIVALMFVSACNSTKNLTEAQIAIKDYMKEHKLRAKPQESGLYYIETLKGTGEQAKKGDVVRVHYKGMLLDGTKFDSSYDRNEPFEFTLGQGRVIKGWDEGIALMKEGEKATLIIPSDLAYGNRGAGSVIKPNSTLVFEVELVEIKK